MVDTLSPSIIALGYDLFSIKLYWVACSALWCYDYFLTLDDEIQYAWKGRKTPVFWLFILNRYLAPCFVVITLVAYFAESFTLEVSVICGRYGFMESIETVLLTSTAEIFIAIRVYAITRKNLIFPCIAGLILMCQWAIALYATASLSTQDHPALLLSRDLLPLPTLPAADPYHVCIFISTLTAVPFVKAFLSLSLAFDGMAFLIILSVNLRSSSLYRLMPMMRIIQRDGAIYFLIIFSSNLVWLLLLLYARPALKFMQNQPAMIISAIMINRITLNLKKASQRSAQLGWDIRTFEQVTEINQGRCVFVRTEDSGGYWKDENEYELSDR